VIDKQACCIIFLKTHVFKWVSHGSSMQGWRCPWLASTGTKQREAALLTRHWELAYLSRQAIQQQTPLPS
jgi:hypothetical protein